MYFSLIYIFFNKPLENHAVVDTWTIWFCFVLITTSLCFSIVFHKFAFTHNATQVICLPTFKCGQSILFRHLMSYAQRITQALCLPLTIRLQWSNIHCITNIKNKELNKNTYVRAHRKKYHIKIKAKRKDGPITTIRFGKKIGIHFRCVFIYQQLLTA